MISAGSSGVVLRCDHPSCGKAANVIADRVQVTGSGVSAMFRLPSGWTAEDASTVRCDTHAGERVTGL